MTRLCGNSDDLLMALAKTGVLEQQFTGSHHFARVWPVVILERAELLWKRDENIEAVETLRSLVDLPRAGALAFSLTPRELILAKLVRLETADFADKTGVVDISTTS